MILDSNIESKSLMFWVGSVLLYSNIYYLHLVQNVDHFPILSGMIGLDWWTKIIFLGNSSPHNYYDNKGLQTGSFSEYMTSRSNISFYALNKQWLHCRKWQFLIAYMVHKWLSWFKNQLLLISFFFFFFWCIILLLIIFV